MDSDVEKISKIWPRHLEKWQRDKEFAIEDKKDHHGYFQPEREKFHFVTIRQLHLFFGLERKFQKRFVELKFEKL